MNVPAAAALAGPLVSAEHTGAFLRLQRLLEKRSHFSLLLAAVEDSAYRDALIARLQTTCPSARVDLTSADTPEDWLHRLQLARAEGALRVHVCLPISPTRPPSWWHQANVLRERLADAFPAAQVLWLSDADVDAAAHHAPDLWNWREGVFGFSASRIQPGLNVPWVPGQPFDAFGGGAEAAAVAERLRHIKNTLDEGDADDSARAHLLLEAAHGYQRLGDWAQAEIAAQGAMQGFLRVGNDAAAALSLALIAYLQWQRGDAAGALQQLQRDVLPVFARLGDVRLVAVTLGRIADIFQAQGKMDEALRIRREEQLPVYERLDDLREKAVTMSKIADILQARGQLDEALRIRREEELPVFERLGDVRSKAVTMGKIADILQDRGQVEEALRLRREEELPVYERLGDVRERAVAMGKVANVLQARGQMDEALALHNERRRLVDELQDSDGMAHVRYAVADLMLARGDHQRGGLPVIHAYLAEAYQLSQQSGRTDAIAHIGALLCRVLVMLQRFDEALQVSGQAEQAYLTLGQDAGAQQMRELRKTIEAERDATAAAGSAPPVP